MKLIRFRRPGVYYGEIAFNEAHLQAKLAGDMAEVDMPRKALFVRLWLKLCPMKAIEAKLGEPTQLVVKRRWRA